jgi:DNA modification methylase
MTLHQLPLPIHKVDQAKRSGTYKERLIALLEGDLDFHDQDSGYASHNFHSFPAKFPPQLPRKFIAGLTDPGDVVLDPMMGSGTTVLEALLSGRKGVGVDIDPLALRIAKVKLTSANAPQVAQTAKWVLRQATSAVKEQCSALEEALERKWNPKTRKFVNYWFARETQIELLALISEIGKISEPDLRSFFELAFSAIVITKSGGVSLAFDLAHTRPHRAKVVYNRAGDIVLGKDLADNPSRRVKFLTKTLRSPLEEFEKRVESNLAGLFRFDAMGIEPLVTFGDAQGLPLGDGSIDLIVTSPPYASNAIDYMRAHKFSLVWMGYPIDDLGQKRREYIGGEAITDFTFEELPVGTAGVVAEVTDLDEKKGLVLHRYYSEMTRTLREMFRVLKTRKAAIVVVGTSLMRGRDTETQSCLVEIGQEIGFEVLRIGVRNLDRNRRMMPAGAKLDLDSQIQQRMHEEYVLGFYKPEA